MFNGIITAKELIDTLKNEVDIAIPIPDETYILWLNTAEQLLYTEIIKEQKLYIQKVSEIESGIVELVNIGVSQEENLMRFEDVYAVYADSTQLIKSTLTSGVIFPNTYFKSGNNIGLNIAEGTEDIKIIYFVKPALKTTKNYDKETLKVPVEFVSLIAARLRGEAYKLANEDALAAKWINEYNVLLETFKAWINNKAPQFGM